MRGIELPVTTAAQAVDVIKALGRHRYAAGRLHLVHAFAFMALKDTPNELNEARAWAERTLNTRDIDQSSRDERLQRRATDRELALLLEAFWVGDSRSIAQANLKEWITRAGLPLSEAAPFDEAAEDDIHPLLIDAGWELLPLAELDPERHRGAMDAYETRTHFEAAKFEEECAIPPLPHLQELSAMGYAELTRATDAQGSWLHPFTIWVDGDEIYQDYVIRGVSRAAKL